MTKRTLLGFGILMIGIFILVGCGQQTPQVNTTFAAPGNLVIKGIIYARSYQRSDDTATSYSSHTGAPIAGATVTLDGSYETKTTTTNANGEYVFENMRYGYYRMTVKKDGYQAEYDGISTANISGSIVTMDEFMNVHPIIRTLAPAPSSSIEASAVFVVTFNKAMDTSTVKPVLLPAGLRTFAAGDSVGLTCTWTSNDTVCTITPRSALLPNLNYRLYLTNTTGVFEDVKDKDGHVLAVRIGTSNGVLVEEDGNIIEDVNQYFMFKTNSGSLPGDPSNLTLSYAVGTTTEASYNRVFNTTGLALGWATPATGGPITGYNVYVAYGASGDYSKMNVNPISTNFYIMTTDGSGNDIIEVLYGAGATRDPVCSGGYPFLNDVCRFKVVALNGEGESATGATISGRDTLGPGVSTDHGASSTAWPIPGGLLSNGQSLPALTSGSDVYLFFTEPISAVVDATKVRIGTATGSSASITNNNSTPYTGGIWGTVNTRSIVKVTMSAGVVATNRITVEAGAVSDLSGNTNPLQNSALFVLQ